MANILVVDDEIGIRELLSEILRDEGHDVTLAEHASAARLARQQARPDLVLLDIWMPDTDGITLLREWSAAGQLDMPVIMMSGHGTIDTAVEATRIGAQDYLEKPISLQKLLASVKRALQRPATTANAPLSLLSLPRSQHFKELRRRLEQVTANSHYVVLRSAPGGMPELIARTLQNQGKGWIDLGQQSTPLSLEQLEATRGGVLFVSELSTLSRAQQKNVAFALERLERYELLLVCGCEHATTDLLQRGWDEPLLRHLLEVTLAVPTLGEMGDELPELAALVLQQQIGKGEVQSHQFQTAALTLLRQHGWPGGFAELQSTVRSLALGALETEITAADVQRLLAPAPAMPAAISMDLPLREAREAFEKLYFEHHLRLESGNMTKLAEKTGLERTHLYRKLKQLGIQTSRKHDVDEM